MYMMFFIVLLNPTLYYPSPRVAFIYINLMKEVLILLVGISLAICITGESVTGKVI